MIKSGNYIIIPAGISSFVLEVKEDGKLDLVGDKQEKTIDMILNYVRKTLTHMVKEEQTVQERVSRTYKRFVVNKEFMSKEELEYTEKTWTDFSLEKFTTASNAIIVNFNKSLYELTDLMLEHNIVLESVDSETPGIKTVTMKDVQNLLESLGRTPEEE